MSIHFTYNSDVCKDTLKQGDILKRTKELDELISTVHPHYAGNEYEYFQIISQSCDLVRRGSSKTCSSRYITLAAVRSLDTVVQRAVQEEAEANKQVRIGNVTWCSDKHKSRISQTLDSLFNNNDKNYFFLKALPEYGLSKDCCTFLRLSIAIRATDHYEKCLDAKVIQLDENFQAKLGWLVGNLYSRVGTEDFVPGCLDTKEQFNDYINAVLDQHVAWVPATSFAEFRKIYNANKDIKSPDEIKSEALNSLVEKKEERLDHFVNMLVKTAGVDAEGKEKIRNFLKSSAARNFINL